MLFSGCEAATVPSSSSIVVAGWNVMQLANASGGSGGKFVGTFYAITPDTNADAASVAWNGPTCTDLITFVEEFRSDTGSIAIDGDSMAVATGACDITYSIQHDGAAVWVGCHPMAGILGVGNGWMKGADDADGDWAEYKLTTDPPNTPEPSAFVMAAAPYAVSAVGVYAP